MAKKKIGSTKKESYHQKKSPPKTYFDNPKEGLPPKKFLPPNMFTTENLFHRRKVFTIEKRFSPVKVFYQQKITTQKSTLTFFIAENIYNPQKGLP